MRILSAATTDRGLRRDGNEDSFSLRPNLGLFVIADGMGGHAAGEVASSVAADAIEGFIEHTAGMDDQITWPSGFDPDLGVDGNRLTSAFRIANHNIQQRVIDEPLLHGMATTAVALLLAQNGSTAPSALVAHVGDSRAYLWREGSLKQVTRDHSWVAEQILLGTLTEDDARHHPWRNLVTRALSGSEDPDVDVTPVELQAGDRVLLCSDGLSTPVPDAAIAGIMARTPAGDVDGLCSALVAAANAAGGPDNITVIVVELTKE